MRVFAINNSQPFLILSVLIFAYFATSCADTLNIQLFLFKAKVNNLIAFLLFFLLFFNRPIKIDKGVAIAGIFIFFSILFSSLFSFYFFRSFGYAIVYLIELFGYFLLSYHLIYFLDENRIFRLYFLAFSFVGLHGLLQLIFSFWGVHIPHAGQFIGSIIRPSAFAYEPSYYALYMTSFASIYNSYYLFSPEKEKKMFIILVWVNCLLLLSTATSALYGYFFFFFVLFAIYFQLKKKDRPALFFSKMRKIMLGFTLSFIFALYAFNQIMVRYFLKFFYVGFMHHSFQARWQGIVACWRVFLENPFFGVGIGGVGPYRLVKEANFNSSSVSSLEAIEQFDPTNALTEVLASLGIVGLFGFILLGFEFLRSFRRVIALPNEFISKKRIGIALFVSFLTVIAVLQFNQGLFRNYIWIHAGITLGYLHKITDRYNVKSTISTDEAEEKIKCPA